ncbi:transporter substrate-binding domain-containing protein [Thalassomonas sp. RHCl1]|uniref:transporter substrate-binding domain-containing protein n=1 Tax=Thalassomonas sp. RHCl1 TaxID=2995320 RepID=UPI00248A99A5|nr:transporter substrate-binding domain-containing protein [Thalassomonas sp. RHCl1]
MKIAAIWSLALLLVSPMLAGAEPVRTLTYSFTDVRYHYCTDVIKLLLQKSEDKFGPTRLVRHPYAEVLNSSDPRKLQFMVDGTVDVNCVGYNQERAPKFNWVEPGITMGLLGYRILLIREGTQPKFTQVKALADLNLGLRGGFVSTWADMHVLKHNKVKTVTANNYRSLLAMLKAGRFEYISRGINEIWAEIAADQKAEQNAVLAAENSLAFFYPADHFIATAKTNSQLAKQLKYGMAKALADGSLKQLFLKAMEDVLLKAQVKKRRVFHLDSPEPMLTIKTDWWMNNKPVEQ